MALRAASATRTVRAERVPNRRAVSATRTVAPLNDPAQGKGSRRVELADGLRFFVKDCRERVHCRVLAERTFARRHLIKQRTERELGGAEVERPAARLLRRHVPDGSEHDSRFG